MKQSRNLSKKIFVLGGLVFAFAVASYIAQINSFTALAYSVATSNAELQKLQREHSTTSASVAKDFSLQNVATLAAGLNFEKVDKVTYVQVLGGSVAQRTNLKE